MLDLHERLWRKPTTALTSARAQAVAGMGGVGKSTFVREYAETFWRCYRTIAWIQAEQAELIPGQFARLAVEMDLIPQLTTNAQSDAILALHRLQDGNNLMILDNATDELSIHDWIPGGGECRTIITSRFAQWSDVDQISVDILELGPARDLLLSRTGLQSGSHQNAPSKSDLSVADEIVSNLGFHMKLTHFELAHSALQVNICSG